MLKRISLRIKAENEVKIAVLKYKENYFVSVLAIEQQQINFFFYDPKIDLELLIF